MGAHHCAAEQGTLHLLAVADGEVVVLVHAVEPHLRGSSNTNNGEKKLSGKVREILEPTCGN